MKFVVLGPAKTRVEFKPTLPSFLSIGTSLSGSLPLHGYRETILFALVSPIKLHFLCTLPQEWVLLGYLQETNFSSEQPTPHQQYKIHKAHLWQNQSR